MQLELYFAEQKTGSCCFSWKKKVCPHYEEFSIVFLKLINIYIVNKSLVFIA